MTEYYQATKKALEAGTFVSVHSMLKDLEDTIWFNSDHARSEIFKAIKDHG